MNLGSSLVMTRWSVLQRTSGEGKSSGSEARTGESGQREREERTGGEAKGARRKEKTGRKPEWGVCFHPAGAQQQHPASNRSLKWSFVAAGGRAAPGRAEGKRSCC